MSTKHESIKLLIKIINDTFGHDVFTIEDNWDDFYAIGLKRDKKLIYLSTYKLEPGNYSYECETLLNNSDHPYILHSEENNVNESRILEVISNFFDIK